MVLVSLWGAAFAGETSHTVRLSSGGRYAVDLTTHSRVANRAVIIRNTGTADIVNPWLMANGRGDWFDAPRIAAEAAGGTSTPLEKAWKTWHFVRRNTTHWWPAEDGAEVQDVTKLFNVYGYGFCDDVATALEYMWKATGIEARSWVMSGHIISEFKLGDRFTMLDADRDVFYPLEDLETIAGVEDCTSRTELVARVSPPNIVDMYGETNKVMFQQGYATTHTMAMRLRPGEALERCFTNRGKFHALMSREEPPTYGNGRLTYTEDFSTTAFRRNFSRITNVASRTEDQAVTSGPAVFAQDPKQPAFITYAAESAYPFLDGTVTIDAHLTTAEQQIQVLARAPRRQKLLGTIKGPFSGQRTFSLKAFIAADRLPAMYNFTVQVGFGVNHSPAAAGLNGFALDADIQCAPASLPALLGGRVNDLELEMTGKPGAQAEITHVWRENTEPHLAPPSRPIIPANGDTITSSAPVLTWEWDLPDGQTAWRRVSVFRDPKGIISALAPRLAVGEGPNRFDMPEGWLKPGETYYWRVSTGTTADQRGPLWSFRVGPE
ncbi:hypothetical protein CVU37_02525 [candidate division BRC1 bacterium HGW-BRC1-1]|nr:MAG: hypothetical protein CVU37_02525 [candidate division BRC1 bacterium HGW-BRC1-1]